jgi:hypothetical protein
MPSVGRIAKGSHKDTVLYEIYMLRFSFRHLLPLSNSSGPETWSWLEVFLLHYRNLIEFLGRDKGLRRSDLHILKLWERDGLPAPHDLNEVYTKGNALFIDPEIGHDMISKRLAHCTDVRRHLKEWRVEKMYAGIESLISRIESTLEPYPPELQPEESPVLMVE